MMTLEIFRQKIAAGDALEGAEMIAFMRAQSDISRRVQSELNNSYHSPNEIRQIFARLTEQPVDETFTLFPPFYTDFGRNIHIGKRVFINSCCQFQDQGGIYIGDDCLIGHSVILATLNHHLEPSLRQNLDHAPIRIGKGAWIGARVTILAGVTIGEYAVVAAGAVVTKDVAPYTIVAGVPARLLRRIEQGEHCKRDAERGTDTRDE